MLAFPRSALAPGRAPLGSASTPFHPLARWGAESSAGYGLVWHEIAIARALDWRGASFVPVPLT